MAKWINVNQSRMQIGFVSDTTFPFEVYLDEYNKMDNHTMPLHWHKLMEYELVLSGTLEMRIDDEVTILDAGDCAFVNSNTLHSGTQVSTSEDAVVYAICFSPDILTESVQSTLYKKYFKPLYGKKLYGFRIDGGSDTGGNIRDLLSSLAKIDKNSFEYELAVISKVSELWLNTIQYINENKLESSDNIETHSHQNNVIKSLLVYVQENYDKNITVDTLSAHAHISNSECSRYFKQYTEKTPLEYVKDYRLSQAEHLLRTTTLSIIDICLSCGFSGQSYFGEMFKQRYGVSPAKYRKDNK